MNNEYVIITDSGTDFTKEMIEYTGVRMLDLTVLVEGRDPQPNSDVDPKEFYAALRSKIQAKTAAINTDGFVSAMEPILKEGKDVLYLGFSSGLSGTYAAGRLAADELSEKYPERKIYAVDTLCASLGEGLIVYLAAEMQKSGADIDTVRAFVEDKKLNLAHWFTVDDLFFLKRGGRVSGATAVVGTMLGIKPVMHVDNEGKLVKVTTARGRRASIDAIFEKIKASIIDPKDSYVFISHGDCENDANYLADKVKKELGVKDVQIGYVGAVIGSHSGPGTLAIFCIGTER